MRTHFYSSADSSFHIKHLHRVHLLLRAETAATSIFTSTNFFCLAPYTKYSKHKQLIMINRLLADLDKTVKIHHDNTEVKQDNVVLK